MFTFRPRPATGDQFKKPKEMVVRRILIGSSLVVVITAMVMIVSTSASPASSTTTSRAMVRGSSQAINLRAAPVIGVLTEVLRDYKRFSKDRKLFLVSSYVKWLEGAGAQVLPVLLNQNDTYYEWVVEQTNGLLFPGGDNLLDPHKDTPMMVAARKLYRLAVAANDGGDYYPIWGTCLGFELLSVLSSNKNVLSDCSANDLALPMSFVGERGRMFAPADHADLKLGVDYPQKIINALSAANVTYNFHHKCLTDADLAEAGLLDFYRPLAYSLDLIGTRFIAIFEALKYPFYGVQFHPEKPAYEFAKLRHQRQIPHSMQAVAASRFFADFFVNETRKSGHRHRLGQQLIKSLIYAYNPTYTAPVRDMYEQRYLFPYRELASISSEEFLDRLPLEDEELSEEVTKVPVEQNKNSTLLEYS